MTTAHSPAPAHAHANDDADRWREAARLRREHRRWVVIWLAPLGQFRAYARLPGARRDTALTARTPADLAAQISHAEQAAPVRYPREPGRCHPGPGRRHDQPRPRRDHHRATVTAFA